MGNCDSGDYSNRSISRSMASIDISSETCLETLGASQSKQILSQERGLRT